MEPSSSPSDFSDGPGDPGMSFFPSDTALNLEVMDGLSDKVIPLHLSDLYSVVNKDLLLWFKARDHRDRRWWEERFFEAGFRKHPCIQKIIPYTSPVHEGASLLLYFEKIPQPANQLYPLSLLKMERDLHMDMLRESGARSDAHIARYQLAAEMAANGDVILDAACGLGYGSALLASQFPSSTVIGLDNSAFAVEYARANFASVLSNVEFYESDVCDVRKVLSGRKLNLLVSFETIEHIPKPEIFLAEATRCMHKDGRFIGSVPNFWVDENGGPGPYHFQVFDFARFQSLLKPFICLDRIFRQNAEHGVKGDFGRILRRIENNQPDQNDLTEAEWWIAAGRLSVQASSPVEPVCKVNPNQWGKNAQQAEFDYHRANKWRQTPDFMKQTSALFKHFGLFSKDYKAKTIIDLGAGSKLRSSYFSEAEVVAIEPLAARFLREIDWCDLAQAREVYSVPAETRIEACIGRADLLISINVLDHCFDFESILDNIHLYLKPGGLAFLSFDKHSSADHLHPLVLTEEICEQIFSDKGFVIEKRTTGFGGVLNEDSYGHVGYCLNYWLRKPEKRTLNQVHKMCKPDWLLLPTGVTQLQTMAAALMAMGITPPAVQVLSIIGVFNDAMHRALDLCSDAFGYRYLGNYSRALYDFHIDPQSLSDEERRFWDMDPSKFVADQLEPHHPDLRKYRGMHIVATARPNMPEDFFLLSALNPSSLVLVADGIQNEVIIRRRVGDEWRGFRKEVATFPTHEEIWCPDYLSNDTAGIGTARIIGTTALDKANYQLRNSEPGQALRRQVLSLGRPPRAIILSQHFALSNLCSEQQEHDYYCAIIRHLIRRGGLPILFKRHPRDPISKTERLVESLADYTSQIIYTDDLASCVPIECLSDIWTDQIPVLIGSSSSAMLGLRSLLHGPAYCADAEFLPDPMRQQIILFSTKNQIPRLSLESQ
jgi:2-polyprenyl-3-methyl-5-hydroxy-6-metoxy-1,4-benzoquinol methylase